MNREEMSTPAERRIGLLPIILTADQGLCDYLTAENLQAIQVDISNYDALRHVYLRLQKSHDIVGILCFSGETGTELCRHFDLPEPICGSDQGNGDRITQSVILARARVPMPAHLEVNEKEAQSVVAEIGTTAGVRPIVPDVAAIATAITGVTAFAVAQGLTYPLISLVMERRGVPLTISGLNSGAYAMGLAVATFAVGRLTHVLRGDYLIVLSLIGCACCLATFASFDLLWLWFVARFALGFFASIIFVLSEAWLNTACPNRLRGRVSGVYGMGLCGGFAAGPLAITFFGTDDGLAFASLSGYVTLVAFLTFILGLYARTKPERGATGELLKFFSKAPLLIIMVSTFAFADIAAISTMPIFFVRIGHSATFAAASVTALALPTAIIQPAIGWLLDRTSRRAVAICSGFVAGASYLAIPFMTSELGILSAFALMGAANFALYTCALTMLGDRFSGSALVTGSAAFTLAYATGCAAGSSITASAMELVASVAGPITAGIVLLAFTFVMIVNAFLRRNDGT
ncbi:MFS transporter [Rhizobium leguminosarum]|uniref:MFS transporter n=1 Tax=Rhizobium leguminosarum TaxID=384 RepID=UPI0004ACEB10|nr:MFS transporter [Rhizobium leguminosarum]